MKCPTRKSNSHKGQNGRIGIVGGNEIYHGAPILAALGAEATGVDLCFAFVPQKHEIPTRTASHNFIVFLLVNNFLDQKSASPILDLCEKLDVLVIGNGLGQKPESQKALLHILAHITIPVVIDAEGLIPEILEIKPKSNWILSPHEAEFNRLFGCPGTEENVIKMAKKHQVTICKKSPVDLIADPEGNHYKNTTGVPQMTVGGSGDALAGIIGGFIAQKMTPFEACCTATHYWGKCGEHLAKKQSHFTTHKMCKYFPKSLLPNTC